MICPECGKDNNKVVNHTRIECGVYNKDIARKRKCLSCGAIFETIERWDGKDEEHGESNK